MGQRGQRCGRRLTVWPLLLLTAAMPSPAFGQDALPVLPPPTRYEAPADGQLPPAGPVTLASLEALALTNNPTLPAARALVQQEQGLYRQAGLYPNPTAGYVRTDPNQPGQSETQGIFLSQEFVTAGKLRLAQGAERQEIEWRRWQLTAQEGRVLNDVRIRFYETLGAQETVRAAQGIERLALEGVQAAEELLKARQGTRPDVLQARIQLQAIRSSLQDARYRHESAWRQLANVAGVPQMHPVPLAGSLEADLPELKWEESLRRLLEASPVLRAQEAQIRAAGYEVRLARAQAIPNVTVQIVAQHDQVQKFDTLSTLVALPIPIFNRNQGNIQSTQAVLTQQMREFDRVQLALTDQLTVAFQQYLTARNQVERLRKDILPLARENLELTTKGYKLRQFDFLRVLNARQTYFNTNLGYLDALTALHKITIEIEGLELTGGLNPTEVGTALQTAAGTGPAGARNVLFNQLQERGNTATRVLPGAIQAGEK